MMLQDGFSYFYLWINSKALELTRQCHTGKTNSSLGLGGEHVMLDS